LTFDLNVSCLKDEFPLPITDVMIDNTCGIKIMSFMDSFSEYNQIKIFPDDEKHTSFRTPLGVFCYTIMPFGLKNAGATYQRAMNTIFRDHLRKTVECYVDDIAIKSRDKNSHLHDLRTMFDLMRVHQLKMTRRSLSWELQVASSWDSISKRIHLDPDKIKAIQDMQPPKNLKELRALQNWLAYIRRFIVNLPGRCQPFTRLMKKSVSFVWDDACQNAFEDIKTYLTKPLILVSPIAGKPFLLYVRAMDHFLSALLTQKNDEGTEHAIHYLSRTLIGAESRHNPIKKGVSHSCFCHPGDAALLGRADYSCHLKSQSSSDSYDKAKFSKLQIG